MFYSVQAALGRVTSPLVRSLEQPAEVLQRTGSSSMFQRSRWTSGSAIRRLPTNPVNVNTSGLLARGLNNLKVITGDGNDTIAVVGNSLNLPTTTNRLTVDAGIGVDQLDVNGDFDYTLSGDTNALTSSMIGNLSLLGLGLSTDGIRLIGGSSGNRFIVTNCPVPLPWMAQRGPIF